jgi:uncharacterized protein (TIGR02466 family)
MPQNINAQLDVDVTKKTNTQVYKPFGPLIVKTKMSDTLCKVLQGIFKLNRDKSSLDNDEDMGWHLAGNMKREFTLSTKELGDNAGMFVEELGYGAGELYNKTIQQIWNHRKETYTKAHHDIIYNQLQTPNVTVAIRNAWGNISVAGDFNPIHNHSGNVSGVGYLKLPEDIEKEWESEDHDPSAGMINFTGSIPTAMTDHLFRAKPIVGDLWFFPAHLLHEVYPFRSKGERWSFSFNIDVKNLNPDLSLSDEKKQELKKIIGKK